MKLIVGLGNPGRKYAASRHNVGFEVVAELARRHAQGRSKEKFKGEFADAEIAGHRVVLLQPGTYMNRSGQSVQSARDFFKLANEDLLVVCDDFNLPLARLRVRARGSAGGQRGLEDIIRCLGSQEFARLRIGIGPVPDAWDPADFVLGRFAAAERSAVEQAVAQAADAAATWVREGVESCMNRYNAN
jgi:PTH1 family peptidyl-tRNA hydrolase